MILIVDALNAPDFQDVLDDMFRLRGRVFKNRLDWNVTLDAEGREIDMFDRLDPAHVIALDESGHVVGCMRLLQTTGPHMLADVFSSLLDGEPPLRSPQIWEATRFCVDTERLGRGRGQNSVSHVTSEVMIGAFEYGLRAGITDAVAVIDPVMDRVMRRSGNAPEDYLGSPKPMGKVTAIAALMDCSERRIASIRDYAGITGDVFLTEEESRALVDGGTEEVLQDDNVVAMPGAEPARTRISQAELDDYLSEQLEAAQSEREIAASRALRVVLSEILGSAAA